MMSAGLHLNNCTKGEIRLDYLEESMVDTLTLSDDNGNSVTVFLTLEQINQLQLALAHHVVDRGGLK